jgi:hypothetical protein
MANADAFNSGFDAGMGKKSKKKKGKGDGNSELIQQPTPATIANPMRHSGGKIRKTGDYRLRKGERVLTIAQQKAVGIKKGKKKAHGRKRVAGKK